tara:strand:+ start:1023 stop:1268 length:246 start_codon:yes stop_codon:yes gene_type:complete
MTQAQKENSWNGVFHRILTRTVCDFDLAIAIARKTCGSGVANYALENKELIIMQAKKSAQFRAERGVRLGFANPAHNNINI